MMRQTPFDRHGTTLVECVVAASILSVAIGTVTTCVFRVSNIWTDTGHHRIAVQEVSNHLEVLTQLPVAEIQAAIDSLTVSDAVGRSLANATLTGELLNDEFGERVRLELRWQSSRPVRPIRMTAWLAATATEAP